MPEVTGRDIILSLRKKWMINAALSASLFAISAAFILNMILFKIFLLSFWWVVPLFIIAFGSVLFLNRSWDITALDVAKFLNKKYPQLEESCGLYLKPAEELNQLEKLQLERVEIVISVIERPKEFIKLLRISALTLIFALIVSLALSVVPFNIHKNVNRNVIPANETTKPEKVLPGINDINIRISPPAYTHMPVTNQAQFSLHIAEGSELTWQIQTTAAVRSLQLLFNDSGLLKLTAINKDHTLWATHKKIINSGFYQVALDSNISEFYKIEVVKDQPPVITIQSPKPSTVIDYGEPERIDINADISDDYGVKDAAIIATIATGSGEAVKFKEQKITFANSFSKEFTQYHVQRLIDLTALGMQPGDELYFYIRAEDNNGHERRSDIHIVSIADTAQLSDAEGLTGGIKIKPEYFRSERQIIIETEQLIKDKDTLAQQEFNNRSNNLGIDQKLLRLRYGKFLGEEEEAGEGTPGADNDVLSDPNNFGNAAKILDQFTDKHDNAEDATFFDAETKKELIATLTEMWNAEIHLRTFKPQEALPYEYKALRLLKDLQQKSRVYVAKTNFRTTPLKPEKRLTGDLSKIIQPEQQAATQNKDQADQISANALGILEQLRTGNGLNNDELQILQRSAQYLSNKAAAEPSVYLPALQSMNELLKALKNKEQLSIPGISIIENALQKMTAVPMRLPAKNNGTQYDELQQQYFKNLTKPPGGQ